MLIHNVYMCLLFSVKKLPVAVTSLDYAEQVGAI